VWRHPELWAVLVSGGAWFFLIGTGAFTGGALHAYTGFAGHMHGLGVHTAWYVGLARIWPALALWAFMIAAMMFPPLIRQLRVVAARSLWPRRNRAMALFLLGYSALWLLYGFAAEACLRLQRNLWPAATFLIPLCFLTAALWQLTPQKRRSLVACHHTIPLAPSGWRADFDCWRYGLRTAANCCVSCWALMFACAAAGHALWSLLVVTGISWPERFRPRSRQRWFALALFATALYELKK